MLNPFEVKKFINRPVDNYEWLKELPRKDILWCLEALKPRPNVADLDLHQLVMLLVGIVCGHFAFWAGPGTGKTLVCLRLMEYWHACGEMRRGVVGVPSIEAVVSWEDEAEKWKFGLPIIGLDDSTSLAKAEKWLMLEEGVTIIPYPSLSAMVTVTAPEIKRGVETGKTKKTLRRRALTLLTNNIGSIVWDESTELMHSDSLQFRAARFMSRRIPHRIGLAGRPFGRDATNLWAQQYLVDHGASLGTTLEMFREALFDKKQKYFGGPHSFTYKLAPERAPLLHKMSAHRSIQYKTEECVDLPPLISRIVNMNFPASTLEYYDKILEHMIAARGDKKAVQNDFIRLRQLSSGFIGVANDEYGAKATITFDKNPKLDMLIELVKQVPEGQKIIIPYFFTFSGEQICARLRKAKVNHVWLWSGTKDRRNTLHKFQRDPACEVMVMNYMLGSMVLNLQMARYMFVYESPISPIDRDQLMRRFWRKGQTHKCMLYDLVMRNSADQRILDFCKEGDDLWAAVYDNPRKALLAA